MASLGTPCENKVRKLGATLAMTLIEELEVEAAGRGDRSRDGLVVRFRAMHVELEEHGRDIPITRRRPHMSQARRAGLEQSNNCPQQHRETHSTSCRSGLA
jgi:hypothetical protein